MDRTERFYKIDRILRENSLVSFASLLEALEVSPATLKRDLEYMRNRLHAPIEYDRMRSGYKLAATDRSTPRYELPGLWFSPAEIHALLTLQHLVANLRTGSVLGPHVEAVANRLRAALGDADQDVDELRRRVRILGMASRDVRLEHFEVVGSALLKRRRLHIRYFGRGRGDISTRDISPQRLVHYRDNWYLDSHCHLRDDLRSFSVDAIRTAELLDSVAAEIPDARLDAVLGNGYGIFSGESVTWATLRFTPERARWVAAEQWHPQQKTRYQDDGAFVLQVPYSDARELVMDILRHGADVEVLAPGALRDQVRQSIESMRERYREPAAAS